MNAVIPSLIFGLILISTAPFAMGEEKSYLDKYDASELLVHMKTSSGNLLIDFFPESAPNHVKNFIQLAESEYYDNTAFHRLITDFMIQGGDPKTKPDSGATATEWGTGGTSFSGPDLDAEFNSIQHDRGIVSMARSADPNSAGSQFFIVHEDSNFLDGEYTVFGRIVGSESFDTLDRIANLKTVESDRPKNIEQTRIQQVEIWLKDIMSSAIKAELAIEPDRDIVTGMDTGGFGQVYQSERLGIKFSTPVGWLVQEPPKTDSSQPDVIAAGSMGAVIPSALALTIEDNGGKTVSELRQDRAASLEPSIANKSLKIQKMEDVMINNRQATEIIAEGFFSKDGQDFSVLFIEMTIYDDEKNYTLSLTTDNLTELPKYYNYVLVAARTFQILETTNSQEGSEGGGCLIAPAAYGSEMAPQVQFLREIRDGKIMATQSGTAFMTGFNQFYYSFSPAIADYERENPVFKEAVKVTLTPLLTSLAILNYVDIDTEQEMLGYGIGVILLNIGMYFVAPAAVIIAIKNRRK